MCWGWLQWSAIWFVTVPWSSLWTESLKVSQRWEFRAFSGLSWACAEPCTFPGICGIKYRIMTTTQKKSLYKINSKSIKINKSLTDISSPGFCFSIFWLQLARPSQAAVVKQLQLIVFNKCSVAKWALDAKWALSQVKWKQPYEWSF